MFLPTQVPEPSIEERALEPEPVEAAGDANVGMPLTTVPVG